MARRHPFRSLGVRRARGGAADAPVPGGSASLQRARPGMRPAPAAARRRARHGGDRDGATRHRLDRPPSADAGAVGAAPRLRRRDMGAGVAEVDPVRLARGRRDPGDVQSGARHRECRGRDAAVVRPCGACARGAARQMKPDASRTVYDGKLFDVTVERWGDNEREIVDHPGAVAVLAVDAEQRVVLVRQLREPAQRKLLELPAGTLDEGEEPEACARRELEEETGLTGGTWERGPSFWTTPGFCRELMHLFFAEGVGEGEQRQEADEEIELERIPVAELGSRIDELEDAKTIAGLLLYLRRRGLDPPPVGAPHPTTRCRS